MEHGRECYHCRQWVADGEPHDCWSTTETALTRDLHEDLQDAYDRLRETAAAFGPQRIYAAHHSIMFSTRVCYCFVRPKRAWLEVCVFLGRELRDVRVRTTTRVSRTKVAHLFRLTHRDDVEAPITDWMREAYEFARQGAPSPRPEGAARHRPADERLRRAEGSRNAPLPVAPAGTPPARTRAAKKR